MEDYKKIIEINGIKLEVDMRHARTIDTFKIGDKVKVLVKKYGDSYDTRYGIVVDFNEFQSLPTIVVAYIEASYQDFDVKIVNINSQTKDSAQLALMGELELPVCRQDLEEIIEREISKAEREIAKLRDKKKYVLGVFDKYFSTVEA